MPPFDPGLPTRLVKFAVLTPNLTMGGAERHCASLVKYGPRRGLCCTGAAVHGGDIDYEFLREFTQFAPVFVGYDRFPGEIGRGLPAIHRTATTADAVRAACRGADVLVGWGTTGFADLVDDADARPRVHISHGAVTTLPAPPRGATHLAAVSESARSWYGEDCERPIAVVYNGVDGDRLVPKIGRDAARATWGFAKNHTVCGHFARQSIEKNTLALVRALRVLPINYRALYRTAVPRWAEDLVTPEAAATGVANRVVRLPAVADLGDSYAALDVFVSPSFTEANSLTILEAFYRGIPVAATMTGVIPEFHRQYRDLVAVIDDPYDPRSVARAIEHAAEIPPGKISELSRYARENWSADKMVDDWRRYFELILEKPWTDSISTTNP